MNTSAVFQNSVCLSQEVLIRYVKGELNAVEKRNVELHLADCEICFDTVEGLSLVEKERLNSIQTELSNRIEKRLLQDEKIKTIPLYKRWYSMAAAIAALIVISVYVVNVYEKDTDLAQLEKVQQQPVVENNSAKNETETLSSEVQNVSPTTSQVIATKEKGEATEIKVKSEVANKKNSEAKFKNHNTIAVNETQADEAVSNDIVAVEINEPKKVDARAAQTVTTKDIEKAQVPAADMQTINDQVAMESIASQKATKKSKTVADAPAPNALSGVTFSGKTGTFDYAVYDAGVSAFNAGDFDGALNSMNTILLNQPDNVNTNYYAGAANYELKNYAKAISQLNIVILNKRNTFYEAALWYKGNSLLKLDNKNDAKTALQKVVKQNGKYKQQAEALLKGL